METTTLLAFLTAGALCALILRKYRPDFAVAVGLMTGVLLLGAAIAMLSPVMTLLRQLADAIPDGRVYLSALLKGVGVALLSSVAAALCADCGETSLSACAGTVGKIGVLVAALPVFTDLYELALSLIG